MKRGIWRHPAQESARLYPALCVHDDRCTGSVTVGRTRLPLWALLPAVIHQGWEAACKDYAVAEYHQVTQESIAEFLGCLMEQRGEFGRLLLILADVERREMGRRGRDDRPWPEVGEQRARVVRQLRRCLEALEGEGQKAAGDNGEREEG